MAFVAEATSARTAPSSSICNPLLTSIPTDATAQYQRHQSSNAVFPGSGSHSAPPSPPSPLHDRDSFFHSHRIHHSASKLPAFRFADLRKEPVLGLSVRPQLRPPSPISPDSPVSPNLPGAQNTQNAQNAQNAQNSPASPQTGYFSSGSGERDLCSENGGPMQKVRPSTTSAAANSANDRPNRPGAAAATGAVTGTGTGASTGSSADHNTTVIDTGGPRPNPPAPNPPAAHAHAFQNSSTAASSTLPQQPHLPHHPHPIPPKHASLSSLSSSAAITASSSYASSSTASSAASSAAAPKVVISGSNPTPTITTTTTPATAAATSSAAAATATSPTSTAAPSPAVLPTVPVSPAAVTRPHRTFTDPSPTRASTLHPSVHRRVPASFGASARETTRETASDTDFAVPDSPTQDWADSQLEFILPKSMQISAARSQQQQQQQQQPQASTAASRQADDRRTTTVPTTTTATTTSSRPPISFRAPRSDVSASRPVIPPIRAFRSSGSRKSLHLDMSIRSPGAGSGAGNSDDLDTQDPFQRDRTLRALEGRAAEEEQGILSPRSTRFRFDGDSADNTQNTQNTQTSDNTADIFMRIARDGARNRSSEDEGSASRITRAPSQRRPFSAAVPVRQNTSPPQPTRRLSDQRETARQRWFADEQAALAAKEQAQDRAAALRLATTQKADSTPRTRTVVSAARPSPSTPRSSSFYDTASEVGTSYSRRRPSVTTDNINSNPPLPLRTSTIKSSHSYARTYNSSPLAPRQADNGARQDTHEAAHHGLMEGTESSASTVGAPSTIWDEIDDIRSRMRRIELSNKAAPAAGTTMSRVSDDRPHTATTNATTLSGSPKHVNHSAGHGAADGNRSTTSSQQEQKYQHQHQHQQPLQQQLQQRDAAAAGQPTTQPILLTALQKAKQHISSEVYGAIETAATEVLALSQMVGVAGQPGPISSGASTIGTGGPASVTDRQLRRKADSICRSLTELCIALNDEAAQQSKAAAAAATAAATAQPAASAAPPPQLAAQHQQPQSPPTIIQSREEPLTGEIPPAASASQNYRSATAAASASAVMNRTMARIESRRASSVVGGATQPPPRYSLAPPVSIENSGRRSSLLVGRTRRAVSEEPPEDAMAMANRRSSILLRGRRAGTEEPEEMVHKPSLLRTRRPPTLVNGMDNSQGDENDEDTLRGVRSSSRAETEVGALRQAREYHAREPRSPREPQYQQRDYQPREYSSRDYAAPAMMPSNTYAGSVGESASNPLASSALPRRRLMPTNLTSSRLAAPQTNTATATEMTTSTSTPLLASSRRFLERSNTDRETSDDQQLLLQQQRQRQLQLQQRRTSLSQAAVLNRTSNLSTRRALPRESTLPHLSSAASHVSSYR